MKQSLGAKPLVLPTPVWVICTYNEDGTANAMTAAWGGICCSKPASIAVSLRAATLSHGNINRTRSFCVCVPGRQHAKEADFFGIASGRDTDKFKTTGLTPSRAEYVEAPYVEEFPLALECELAQVVEVGLHTQFIGTIVDVKCDEGVMVGDYPDMNKVSPMLYATGSKTYHGVGDFIGKGFSIGRGYMD